MRMNRTMVGNHENQEGFQPESVGLEVGVSGNETPSRSAVTNAGQAEALVEARFVPQPYEPNYPYPLLVLLHGRGGDERRLIASVPALSRRNYVVLSLRGPEEHVRRDRVVGYGWGAGFRRARSERNADPRTSESPCREKALLLPGGGFELSDRDPFDRIETGVVSAVRGIRRGLHIHSERIFLGGVGEGAAVAYRLALSRPGDFAGVVAINGWIPGGFRPLGRMKECRDLRVLMMQGRWNPRLPLDRARREAGLLSAAGLDVSLRLYSCADRITRRMLGDMDEWLISRCTKSIV